MILTLFIAVIMSLFVLWFVLSPLLSPQNFEMFSVSYKGFADESELTRVILFRDRLLARLTTHASEDPKLTALSDDECLTLLVSVCLRLRRAELPYLPQAAPKPLSRPDSGQASLDFSLLLGLLTVVLSCFLGAAAFAQSSDGRGALPPPLAILEPGIYAPQMNRYMVAPAQGYVIGHHLSSFVVPSTASEELTVVLPLPEKVYDWQLASIRPEALQQSVEFISWQGTPALRIPKGSQSLLVELSSEFKLSAFTGQVQWQNNALGQLPGEQVLVLFSSEGLLHSLLSSVLGGINIWPPRIASVASGMKLQERTLQMDPSRPPRKVQIVSRSDEQKQPFLSFEIIGVTPSRLPLQLLGGWIGAVLLGTALWVGFRGGRWRIDRQSTLPG
jgi:hypothetical protein